VAFPAVATTAETAVTTAGTNHAVTLPTGIAAGDLILVCMAKGAGIATVNAHADYTELLDENAANGLYIAYRYAAGGESNPTFVTSANTRSATIVYRISGAENPATQAPQIGTTATGSSTAPNPPAVTPTGGAKDYLWVALFARSGEEADDDTWVTAAPTNFSGLLQKACGVAGTNLGGMVATATQQANATSLDPAAFTCATGGWRAQTVAIHPRATATLERSAALSATAAVTASGTGFSVVTASAALSAIASIAVAGVASAPPVERSASFGATGTVSAVGQRDLLRAAQFGATTAVTASGSSSTPASTDKFSRMFRGFG
jgi:hypothetical protein